MLCLALAKVTCASNFQVCQGLNASLSLNFVPLYANSRLLNLWFIVLVLVTPIIVAVCNCATIMHWSNIRNESFNMLDLSVTVHTCKYYYIVRILNKNKTLCFWLLDDVQKLRDLHSSHVLAWDTDSLRNILCCSQSHIATANGQYIE